MVRQCTQEGRLEWLCLQVQFLKQQCIQERTLKGATQHPSIQEHIIQRSEGWGVMRPADIMWQQAFTFLAFGLGRTALKLYEVTCTSLLRDPGDQATALGLGHLESAFLLHVV
jgi:hypothetical protein